MSFFKKHKSGYLPRNKRSYQQEEALTLTIKMYYYRLQYYLESVIKHYKKKVLLVN